MPIKKKVLLKVSGELFSGRRGIIDEKAVLDLAREISSLVKVAQIGVVVGGGNIFRGREFEGKNLDMKWAHYAGMMATEINALLLKQALVKLGVKARIISALDIKIPGMIEKNAVDNEITIFAGGTGKPFVSTDSGAVDRAIEMKADLILKATKVRGVFDKDPGKYKKVKQFKEITCAEFIKIKDAKIFDKGACELANKKKIPIYIFQWQKNILNKALEYNASGTLINN